MKKAIVIILTAAVIVGCAFLPAMAAEKIAGVTDPQYSWIQSFSTSTGLAMTEKLRLFCGQGRALPVDESAAEMSEEEVSALALELLDPYSSVGYMSTDPGEFGGYGSPYYYYDVTDMQKSFIVWHVKTALYLDQGIYYYAELTIDDETGKALSISYEESPEPDGVLPELTSEELEAAALAYLYIFIDSLDYTHSLDYEFEKVRESEGYAMYCIDWSNNYIGEVKMFLEVSSHSFRFYTVD